jgi:RNA polymerase sigma-70 factor (ECF subfamily)
VQQLDDEELIDLVARANESALSELYDRYHRLVFSIALNVAGRPEEAEEVTLDVFALLWQKAHTYRPEKAKVYTWLTTLARNKAIDLLRRENVRPLKHSISWAEVYPVPPTRSQSPEHAAELAARKKRVRAAIGQLSEAQREAIALAYFGGLSHSEIARELELPLGTVKGRIRLGMQKLRALLQES